MSVIKCKTHIDVYKERANSCGLESLSGRGEVEVTNFVNKNIINKLNFHKNDVVCDIGCGDASLLKIIAPVIKHGYGFLPTIEEVKLVLSSLSNDHGNIGVNQSLSSNIAVSENTFDTVVCNGVIILLSTVEIDQTLLEIKRISKKGAVVFLGEIPTINESKSGYGDSILLWLIRTLRESGVRSFVSNLKTVFRSIFMKESFIIQPKALFYISKDKFIDQLENAGFEVIEAYQHQTIDRNRKVQNSSRYNYIVRVNK